jgi:uncharacterized protein YbaP (TraB family)
MTRFVSRSLLAGALALASAAPAIAKAPDEFHLFVWKVSNPALEADAPADYMIGTMHVPVGAGQKMPKAVRELVRASSLVVTEADTSTVTPELVNKYAMLKGGKDLKALLPAASWKKLTAAAKPMGLGPDQLAHMEPWFLNLGLTMPTPDGAPVIDELVQTAATDDDVPLRYLETAEDQLRFMDSIVQAEDLKQLIDTLDHPGLARTQFETLKRGYTTGDLKSVEKLVFDPAQLSRYPEFYDKLLYSRTARWAPKLDKMFHDGDVVVAVGLGHLLGDKGLIKLMRDRGYTVEPLAL